MKGEGQNFRGERCRDMVSGWAPSQSREQLLSALRRLSARDGLPERVEEVLERHYLYDDASLFAAVWAAATERPT